ncbi:MAG TPA: acetylglutamate kinase [Terriglobales bacterium]|nr:acetylglutamate kinase [Terriglobales bacterium]
MIAVLKVGGSTLEPEPSPALAAAVARAWAAGMKLLIVHGGGKALSGLSQRLGLQTQFVRGLRVTDGPTLDAALMALGGAVNTRLVAALQAAGVASVGLTGADGGSVRARMAQRELGAVGEVVEVHAALWQLLLERGFTPVVACLASDGAGGLLNVNADLFAAAAATALRAERLAFLTDVEGVLDAEGIRMPRASLSELEALSAAGALTGGMLPKADACRAALAGGAEWVEILGPAAAARLDEALAGGLDSPSAGTRITNRTTI